MISAYFFGELFDVLSVVLQQPVSFTGVVARCPAAIVPPPHDCKRRNSTVGAKMIP
jgi:hypothetical protein